MIVRETGLSFRMAHNIVGTVVRNTLEKIERYDIQASDLDNAALDLFGKKLNISQDIVAEALDPIKNIEQRDLMGGPSPTRMREMIRTRKNVLRDDKKSIAIFSRRVTRSREKLAKDTEIFCRK